jgi:hypothetical protein
LNASDYVSVVIVFGVWVCFDAISVAFADMWLMAQIITGSGLGSGSLCVMLFCAAQVATL